MGVHVDHAGEYQHPGRLDHARRARGQARQVRLDRRDDAAIDGHVRPPRPGRGDDRAAADDEVRHRALAVDLGDPDRLGTLPETAPTDLAQPVLPVVVGAVAHDRREVIRRQRPHLRGRRAAAVREEDLALADPTG